MIGKQLLKQQILNFVCQVCI